MQEEIAFARLLPEGPALIELLHKERGTPWWSDSDLFEREMNFYRGLGAPSWIIEWISNRRKERRGRLSSSEVDRHES